MKLSDLTLPISIEDARKYALMFDENLASRLTELHSIYGTNNCVPIPRILADGRYMLSADVLTEIEFGGLLYHMWEAADKSILMEAVEVVDIDEILADLI